MIFGIYLAAGQSKRMGCPKLSLPYGEQSLGSIAFETAIQSKLDKVILVTREEDTLSWLPPRLGIEPFKKRWIDIKSKEASRGQAESLKSGLIAAQTMGATAVMVLLADQPFVTKGMLNQIITLYLKEKPRYVAACYNGLLRPPVIFDYSLFPTLLKLSGDEGARQIIRSSHHGLSIRFYEERRFVDVDSPEQYEKIKKLLQNNSVY